MIRIKIAGRANNTQQDYCSLQKEDDGIVVKLKMIKEIEMVEGRNHHGAGVIRLRGEEKEKVKGYYSICAIGGMLSAGTTHLAITPLDVLKVNMQVPFPSFLACLGFKLLLIIHGVSLVV